MDSSAIMNASPAMAVGGSGGGNASPFDVRIIGALIAAGIIGFIGYWVLTAFAPELGGGQDGQGHALSRSAIGFSGVVEVGKTVGMDIRTIRDAEEQVGGADTVNSGLLIITPNVSTTAEELIARLDAVRGPVLIVLPKSTTNADPQHRGWVSRRGYVDEPAQSLGSGFSAEASSAPESSRAVELWDGPRFTLLLPDVLQTIRVQQNAVAKAQASDDAFGELEPIISNSNGILLGEMTNRDETYVLSDPDLINNLAMANDARAVAALRLIESIAGRGEPVGFDVVLNGFGAGGKSLLRMAFVPPFLGLTLCLLVAAAFALWQGFVRFGPPWREGRAIALGKAGLVANSAQLIVQARRTPNFAARYGAMVREAAARRLHAPTALSGPALDTWLDRFTDRRGRRFTTLLSDLERAQTANDCVRSAAALGQWRKDIVRDGD